MRLARIAVEHGLKHMVTLGEESPTKVRRFAPRCVFSGRVIINLFGMSVRTQE